MLILENEENSAERAGLTENGADLSPADAISKDSISPISDSVKYSTVRGLEDDFLTGASSEELADVESEVDRRPALQDEQIITLQEQINEFTGQRDDLFRARMILTDIIKYSLTFCGFSV